MNRTVRFLLGIAVCLSAMAAVAYAETPKTVIKFSNDSNDYLSIHWVNPSTGATTNMNINILPQSVFNINSYLGHKFQIWQEPDPKTGHCGKKVGDECLIGDVQVTDPNIQVFTIKEDVEIVTSTEEAELRKFAGLMKAVNLDEVQDPMASLRACEERARNKISELGDESPALIKQIHEELHDCMTVGLTPNIKASFDEVDFERQLRLQASGIAENFTCVNTDLETSPDIATEEWFSPVDLITRTVHKKLDRPASRIHVVENFASPEECHAMEVNAQEDLHVATTADGKGGSRVSAARKAMQASIRPKFHDDGSSIEGDHISILSGRVYEYTNYVLDMNITHHGQEPLMSIQYFGRGRHDIEPDRYTPHCDGRCTGENHVYGSRMATMVIYCTLPEQGGFTNFQNANVHVRPNSGSAVFFSYIDPLTNVTDNGLTQHSGCPVYEGEKKIITQWVRYGVSKKTPHNAFNTLTILRSEDGE